MLKARAGLAGPQTDGGNTMDDGVSGLQTVAVKGRFVLPVVLTPGEDGYIVATCPIVPGCFSQGATRDEALANIAEAAALALACRQEEGWEVPAEYELRSLEISV
jgi:predicted RNase H-like HicB family nuclease